MRLLHGTRHYPLIVCTLLATITIPVDPIAVQFYTTVNMVSYNLIHL